MKITASIGSKSVQLEIIEGDNPILTLGDLKIAVCELGNYETNRVKLIHKGKSLSGPDAALLEKMNFSDGDKIIVMGKVKAALKDDPGFAALIKYEKENLTKLQQNLDDISKDLTDLEKNFLDKKMSMERAKTIDKKLKLFTEIALRHLESIDALNINTEETSPDQAIRNREKRKMMVNGVQTLLNLSDKDVRRLEEYTKKLSGEIIE